MRAFLRATVPDVHGRGSGAAEALPFADGSLDAITVAQAFHWFDAARGAARVPPRPATGWPGRPDLERARSLGAVGRRDVDDHGPRSRSGRHGATTTSGARPRSCDQPWFTPLTEATSTTSNSSTHDEAVDRMRSVSHVAVLPPAEQASVLDEVRAVLDTDPATAGQEVVALPYRVDTYWVERRDRRRDRAPVTDTRPPPTTAGDA